MLFSRSLVLLNSVKYNFAKSKKCIPHRCPKNLKPFIFIKAPYCNIHTDIQNENHSTNSILRENGGYVTEDEPNNNIENNVSDINVFKSDAIDLNLVSRITSGNDFFDTLDQSLKMPTALDKCMEDLSYIGPYMEPTATFAKYANESLTIQQLVKLGVNLAKIEKIKGAVAAILPLNFHTNVAPYIQFLHDIGIQADDIGRFITLNPYIFFQDIKNLKLRLKYLEAHKFTKNMILTILYKHPPWISYNLKGIDRRLGYFQGSFKLSGGQTRQLAVKLPKLITYKLSHIKENTVSIEGDMGFNKRETKTLLLDTPRIWIRSRRRVLETFEFVHTEMGLTHQQILDNSRILDARKKRCEERHKFLVELKRAQYDPKKPLYVSPLSIVTATDVEFCRDIAKCHIDLFNGFLKTL